MKLQDCESIKLLPQFMRSDDFNIALCKGIDSSVSDMWDRIIKSLSFWNYIDDMTEEQLDECAYEFNCYWYKYDANVNQKREIIKCCRFIKAKLGTIWAAEYILSIYFGDASVIEYWNYGGRKKHFKIQTYNSSTVNEDAEDFLKILDKIKRKSCVLDYIEVLEKSTNTVIYCITPHSADIISGKQIGGNL